MNLSKKKCKPCEGGIASLDQKEIAEYKKHIQDDWKVTENNKISKEYSFVNYKHTMEFVNKVANLAEEEGSSSCHPCILR